MRKLSKIEFGEKNQIVCFFEGGEIRILNLYNAIKDRYVEKILSDEQIFKSAKIGDFGELYWAGVGEIRELDGSITACEYDISPEFIYVNSTPVEC